MHVTRDTADRLTAGVTRLLRTGRRLGHGAAADLYGDLPPSGWTLLVVLDQEGPLRCSALAVRLAVDVSVASRHVAALERGGLVVRRPDPLDGRAGLIGLSDAGSAALARVRELRARWALDALRGWDDEEAALLGRLVDRLADDLDRTLRRPPAAAHVPHRTPQENR
ncbi:MarR family winged helix-turn-helix transcriptional regulator [Modestobacter sp. URMC 112]